MKIRPRWLSGRPGQRVCYLLHDTVSCPNWLKGRNLRGTNQAAWRLAEGTTVLWPTTQPSGEEIYWDARGRLLQTPDE